jgi:AmpD protein
MLLSNHKKVTKGNNLLPNTYLENGWILSVNQQKSNFFTPRAINEQISLLVIHNISLPSGEFGNNHITDLFLGNIDVNAHPSFSDLVKLEVSAHCLIKRDGSIIQYVSFDDKAWHAGVSSFQGVDKCNDFSIGIELEGTDDSPYEEDQYNTLAKLTVILQKSYPLISNDNIVGHCDIAKGRKTDPGQAFNWQHFHQCLQVLKVSE